MTEERFIELMDRDSGKYDGDNAYQGLQIIAKYTTNLIHGASHDVIYSESIDTLLDNGIDEYDVNELRRLNWMIEEWPLCLACFV
jgi:hypothetical protein